MHSFNALEGGDVYGTTYGISDFYTSTTAQSQFDARLQHVMNHVHTSLGKPWKELSQYIFAFEAENEAMIGDVSNRRQQQGIYTYSCIGREFHRGPSAVVRNFVSSSKVLCITETTGNAIAQAQSRLN